MADFVAVIRRAVDGLSDNTPEMRVKVYEKARGAVLRQLESMKPRPPEEMLRRQLDKLEAAILEVEAEHAEALPSVEEPEIIVPEEVGPAPVPPEPDEAHAEAGDEGGHAAEEPAYPAQDEPVYPSETATDYPPEVVEPAVAQPAEPSYHETDYREPPATALAPVYPAPLPQVETGFAQASSTHAPALFGDESWAGEEEETIVPVEPAQEPVEVAPYAAPHMQIDEPFLPDPEPTERYVAADEAVEAPAPELPAFEGRDEREELDEFLVEEPTRKYSETVPAQLALPSVPQDQWPEHGLEASATAPSESVEWTVEASYDAPAAEPLAQAAPELVTAYEQAEAPVDPLGWQSQTAPLDNAPEPQDFVEVATVQGELAAAQQDSHDEPILRAEAEYRPELEVAPHHFAAPAESHQPALDEFARREPQLAGLASDNSDRYREPEPVQQPAAEAWDESPFTDVDLPEEPGVQRDAEARPSSDEWDDFDELSGYDRGSAKERDVEEDDFVPPAPEKPARSYRIQQRRRIDFTSIGFGLLGLALVAGSGYGAWTFRDTLSGLVTGLVSTPPGDATKPATSTAPTKPADTTNNASATGTAPAATTTAPASKSATAAPEPQEPEIQKFTQRLKADGTESDDGAATGAGGGEGKSFAPQTVASSEPAATAAQTAPPNSVTTTPAAIPVGVSQKMYLYEERVGQASPVAIEGAVVWSLKHDKAENGKEEAVVQAQVTAPERGLSALITFKRNLDPSLPASHLVELVFSLPKDFEGGAIESVQRVAMKQTEQDRGDPLVAVPAKITDDFHMIALNDYADAREFNLKLLQTRDWIDIPVTYRNGRRALITMEKGATGMEAFNQAIAEWRAADPTASAVPANPAPGPTPAPAQQAPAQAPAAQTPAPNASAVPAPSPNLNSAPAPAANPQ